MSVAWLTRKAPGPSSGKSSSSLGPREKPQSGFSLRNRSDLVFPASRWFAGIVQRTFSLQHCSVQSKLSSRSSPSLRKFPAGLFRGEMFIPYARETFLRYPLVRVTFSSKKSPVERSVPCSPVLMSNISFAVGTVR